MSFGRCWSHPNAKMESRFWTRRPAGLGLVDFLVDRIESAVLVRRQRVLMARFTSNHCRPSQTAAAQVDRPGAHSCIPSPATVSLAAVPSNHPPSSVASGTRGPVLGRWTWAQPTPRRMIDSLSRVSRGTSVSYIPWSYLGGQFSLRLRHSASVVPVQPLGSGAEQSSARHRWE